MYMNLELASKDTVTCVEMQPYESCAVLYLGGDGQQPRQKSGTQFAAVFLFALSPARH